MTIEALPTRSSIRSSAVTRTRSPSRSDERRGAAAGLDDAADDQRPRRVAGLEEQRHLGADGAASSGARLRAGSGVARVAGEDDERRPLVEADQARRSPRRRCARSAAVHRPPSVLVDLRALHRDLARRLHVDLARAGDGDVLALDRDRAVLLHRDRRRAAFQHDRVRRPRSGGSCRP